MRQEKHSSLPVHRPCPAHGRRLPRPAVGFRACSPLRWSVGHSWKGTARWHQQLLFGGDSPSSSQKGREKRTAPGIPAPSQRLWLTRWSVVTLADMQRAKLILPPCRRGAWGWPPPTGLGVSVSVKTACEFQTAAEGSWPRVALGPCSAGSC